MISFVLVSSCMPEYCERSSKEIELERRRRRHEKSFRKGLQSLQMFDNRIPRKRLMNKIAKGVVQSNDGHEAF